MNEGLKEVVEQEMEIGNRGINLGCQTGVSYLPDMIEYWTFDHHRLWGTKGKPQSNQEE